MEWLSWNTHTHHSFLWSQQVWFLHLVWIFFKKSFGIHMWLLICAYFLIKARLIKLVCGVLQTFSTDFSMVMVPPWPAPVFLAFNLCYLPLPTPPACHFKCPFSSTNFVFSLSFSLPLQLFLTLSSAAVLSLKEKTAIIEELVRAPYCLKQETNQFPSPATVHITPHSSVHVSLCPGKKLSSDLHGVLHGSVLS